MRSNPTRRNFLKNLSLGTGVALAIPQIVSEALSAEKVNKIILQKGDVILFQGDSITDAGRKKDNMDFNNSSALGNGYAFLAASELLYRNPDKSLKIYNKGISGNKVYQLAERWEADCFELKPNVLSILIGVNDFWHTLTNNYAGTIKTYKDDLTTLLDRTKQKFPQLKLIIGEPFAVKGIKAVDEKWYPAFDDYRKAAKETAEHFGAIFLPYQAVFDKAQKSAPGVYWTHDGVHPSVAGSKLMADTWLQVIRA